MAAQGKEAGLWLRDHYDAGTVIATNTAGSIPFYSGFKTIDMLGLNDKHIARQDVPGIGQGRPGHEKADGPYVLSLNPDIIQLGSSWCHEATLRYHQKSLVGLREVIKRSLAPRF